MISSAQRFRRPFLGLGGWEVRSSLALSHVLDDRLHEDRQRAPPRRGFPGLGW